MQESTLVEFYKLFKAEAHKSIELHASHLRMFLTILIAIAGATLAGVQHYIDKPFQLGFILIIGGCLGITSVSLGKNMCDRFYEGYLEAVTVLAKLEEELEFTVRKKSGNPDPSARIFPSDDNVIPDRWVEGRRQHKTASAFTTAHMKLGTNKVSRLVFRISLLVFIGVLIGGVLAVALSSNAN